MKRDYEDYKEPLTMFDVLAVTTIYAASIALMVYLIWLSIA
jgi:hypothetical protein